MGQKGHEEELDSSCHGKKDLSHIKCIKCNKYGCYASNCPRRKKGNGFLQCWEGCYKGFSQ
jgi:hypothetical protein